MTNVYLPWCLICAKICCTAVLIFSLTLISNFLSSLNSNGDYAPISAAHKAGHSASTTYLNVSYVLKINSDYFKYGKWLLSTSHTHILKILLHFDVFRSTSIIIREVCVKCKLILTILMLDVPCMMNMWIPQNFPPYIHKYVSSDGFRLKSASI
jgi:hypothetical protein